MGTILIQISPAVLNALFSQSFGADRNALDLQWRSYMRSLKTDVDRFLEQAAR